MTMIPPVAVPQGLPMQKVLTMEVAQESSQVAIAACRANGYKVTVMVVDGANIMKSLLRDDGAPVATVETARLKANSVMVYGRPSGPPPNLPAGVPIPPPTLPGTIYGVGGLPIKGDDQIIGASGVSGAPSGEKDAACANAGLANVASKLK